MHKNLRNFAAHLRKSPGSNFELLKKAYGTAKNNENLVTATDGPSTSKSGGYYVVMESYGDVADPQSEEVPASNPLL